MELTFAFIAGVEAVIIVILLLFLYLMATRQIDVEDYLNSRRWK